MHLHKSYSLSEENRSQEWKGRGKIQTGYHPHSQTRNTPKTHWCGTLFSLPPRHHIINNPIWSSALSTLHSSNQSAHCLLLQTRSKENAMQKNRWLKCLFKGSIGLCISVDTLALSNSFLQTRGEQKVVISVKTSRKGKNSTSAKRKKWCAYSLYTWKVACFLPRTCSYDCSCVDSVAVSEW